MSIQHDQKPDGPRPFMSDDDLAVSVASFERTGMVGAFNRYRAVALDTGESADIVGALVSQPSCFVGGAHDVVRGMIPGADMFADPGASCTDFRGSTIIDGVGHWVQRSASRDQRCARSLPKIVAMRDQAFGPIGELLSDRPPFGPMQRLDGEQLKAEQKATLAQPRRSPSIGAKALFVTMDLAYGTPRTLEKFRVLELVARVPYQAWENVGYVAVTHTARKPRFARRVFEQVRVNRWEQDNEQWHLFVIEEMLSKEPSRLGWLRRQVIPQVLAVLYFHISWLLYVVRPAWSYRLNADFEDHAEHEYALLVQEHPSWETTPFVSEFAEDFGQYHSLAELFRQIGFDERLHKLQSEAMMSAPRYT